MAASCPYKDLFGKPNTGAHALRVWNIAVVDVVATIALAFILARVLHLSFLWVFIALFVVGELLHAWLCVDTTVILWVKKQYKALTQ